MNYIKRLETYRDAAEAKGANVDTEIRLLRRHLASDKFQGVDADGERKDWISINDVLAYLDRIQTANNG